MVAVGMRTRGLMLAIGLLSVLMALPFQCRSAQEELYRLRAVRHDELAADHRAAERRALGRGDLAKAEQHRLEAERLERLAWVYRKASYPFWRWPELLSRRRNP